MPRTNVVGTTAPPDSGAQRCAQAGEREHRIDSTADQRWKLVRTHIAKGDKAQDKAEQHYIAAGRYLAQLKADHAGAWAEWETLVKERAGIGKSRASELMQIADGRKTVDDVRADTAKRTADTKARLKLSATSGEDDTKGREANRRTKLDRELDAGAFHRLRQREAESEALKSEIEELKAEREKRQEQPVDGNGGSVLLQTIEQMPEDDRFSFFEELQNLYPDDYGHPIHESDDDSHIVRTIVEAIGAERAQALAKRMPRLVSKAIGKAALPDCQWCGGSGLWETKQVPGVKFPCDCTRRKPGENDFPALQARLAREDKEQAIPEQDFSFGLEVTTRDGKMWASGVRLATKEEAEFYIDYWARPELHKHGYVPWKDDPACDVLAFDIKRYEERPLMKITGGKRKTLNFMHGTCGLLGWKGWHPIVGGECDCKKCKQHRTREEEYQIVLQAFDNKTITEKQFDQWSTSKRTPAWLVKLKAQAPNCDGLDIPECLRRDRVAS
jgi:hypothetical protein